MKTRSISQEKVDSVHGIVLRTVNQSISVLSNCTRVQRYDGVSVFHMVHRCQSDTSTQCTFQYTTYLKKLTLKFTTCSSCISFRGATHSASAGTISALQTVERSVSEKIYFTAHEDLLHSSANMSVSFRTRLLLHLHGHGTSFSTLLGSMS